MQKEKILITGASGALAQQTSRILLEEGYQVIALTTNKKNLNDSTFYWNPGKKIIDKRALEDCQHIVHLCGYSIMKPWTKRNQQKMYDSRVKSAELLYESCKEENINLKSFISASAIGYYGAEKGIIREENDEAGEDWLAQLAKKWEEAAYKFQNLGTRVACMRIALLIDKNSGYLHAALKSMKLGLAVIFGENSNNIEWIHIKDAARFVSFALNNEHINSSFNLATEQKLTQKEFLCSIILAEKKKAILIKLPSLILGLVFKKRKLILEGGVAVSIQKLKLSGFEWRYPNLALALQKDKQQHP